MAQSPINSFFTAFNRKVESPLQAHLKNVYSSVALSTLSAAVGAYIHVATRLLTGGFLSAIGSLGFMMALMFTRDDGKNSVRRLSYLLAFSFLTGLGLGPILDVVIQINPAIIPTAFLGTCLVFTCFTLASMFSDQRHFIYLGGTLMSLLSLLMICGMLNMFFGYFLFKVQIYGGLLLMCAFIMYDTQVIMEKYRNGDKDYIWQSIALFLDLVQIFRYILIILAEKDNKKNKK